MKAGIAKLVRWKGRTPWKVAWDCYHNWWWRRATARAGRDPTWAGIEERRRRDRPGGTVLFLSEAAELGWAEWDRQKEIFQRLNPVPWPFKAHWWLERHGWSVQRANWVRARQRAKQGWAISDTWNLDHYLAGVIASSVDHVRSHLHGHPGGIGFDEWEDILGRIVEGFWLATLDDDIRDKPESEQKQAEAFELLARWFRHLWD